MSEPKPITTYLLTEHARMEMARRRITEAQVAEVLSRPEQMWYVRTERVVYQSRVIDHEHAKTYLLRVLVDIDRTPPEVVTVYRTSKVDKYWRGES